MNCTGLTEFDLSMLTTLLILLSGRVHFTASRPFLLYISDRLQDKYKRNYRVIPDSVPKSRVRYSSGQCFARNTIIKTSSKSTSIRHLQVKSGRTPLVFHCNKHLILHWLPDDRDRFLQHPKVSSVLALLVCFNTQLSQVIQSTRTTSSAFVHRSHFC